MTRNQSTLDLGNAEVIDLSGDDIQLSATNGYAQQGFNNDNTDIQDLTGQDEELDIVRELTPREAQDFQQALAYRSGLPPGSRELKLAHGPYDIVVKPGMSVQLKPDVKNQIHFFHIKHIVQNAKGDIYLWVLRLKRNYHIHHEVSKQTGSGRLAILPLLKNDLCMQLKSTANKLGSSLQTECLSSEPLDNVEREREIVFTNYGFPAFSYQAKGMSVQIDGKEYVEEHGVLCCRWKHVTEICESSGKTVGYQITTLDHNECDKDKGRSDVDRRRGYGSQQHAQGPTSVYTYGDLCAGGGGTFRAGEMAGLKLSWALDKWPVAVETLRANWPGLARRNRILQLEVQEFVPIIALEDDYQVDVLHISYPCQGHSWRNRGQNPERDANNNATVMTLEGLLKHLRPRVVTLEQTNHILTKNDAFYFRKVVAQITSAGYNVRWKVLDMGEYEVPSARKRLIVTASCPGQQLPQWPKPTHGIGPGLKNRLTIGEAIHNISPYATMHNIVEKKRQYSNNPLKRNVADLNKPLQNIIMTSGAQQLFRDPTDGRFYEPTMRQLMRLMTFPDHHDLIGYKKEDFTTQIGNAVPCTFMKEVFGKVIEALMESDREAEAWEAEVVLID